LLSGRQPVRAGQPDLIDELGKVLKPGEALSILATCLGSGEVGWTYWNGTQTPTLFHLDGLSTSPGLLRPGVFHPRQRGVFYGCASVCLL
jgi:hypothetical protein